MNRRPSMDEELEALDRTATRFFETECVPHEARWAAQHHADREIWRRAGAVGLLCASIPEIDGGAGGSDAHEFVIAAAQGVGQMMQQLPRERLLIAVGAASAMQRAVDETLAFVAGREAFGAPLPALQNTRFELAECATLASVAQTFVDDCIARALEGTLDAATAAKAKWWTTDTLCLMADDCLQLHGGAGYMREYPIARICAESRGGRISGGSNEVMKEVIARDLERGAGPARRPKAPAGPGAGA